MMRETILKLDNVSKSYPGVRALDNVTLECLAGEVHAILGENGSGKSTLLKIASGVVASDSGRVMIQGKALRLADPRAAQALGLATVYQDDSLVRELTVAENLLLGARPGAVDYAEMAAWAQARLAPFGVKIPVAATVLSLTPAERQFVEIIKALLWQPRVLLLDEPTATLDLDGVRHLSAIIRELAAKGTGVVFVSHRLPEILTLADRVTILRDGQFRGTYPVDAKLDEQGLVSLMAGRDIAHEYPPKSAIPSELTLLAVANLQGERFGPVDLALRAGEIIGFAGAEGNGQRATLRAIAGLESCSGTVRCGARQVDPTSPREALAGGIAFLGADRPGEAIFADLSVAKNMTLAVLDRFRRKGVLSAASEREFAQGMKSDFGVVAADLAVAVGTLSGGNQQKAVLARTFRSGAEVFLIDEPTQGVDAGARADIYRLIRENIAGGQGCIVNSSDAQELAGLCDRVLVFSRGKIVSELRGSELTERRIVEGFLTSRDEGAFRKPAQDPVNPLRKILAAMVPGGSDPRLPMMFLLGLCLLVGGYGAFNSDVFLSAVNLRHLLLATVPAALVAMAQLLVLLVRGMDISVGSLMSLTVVLASFVITGSGFAGLLGGVLICAALGVAVGLANGGMVRGLGINAVITTVAMLSILQGAALVLRPTPGGNISGAYVELLRSGIGFVPFSIILVAALALAGDWWLHRTRSGLEVKATGFREEAARRNGVRVTRISLLAFVGAALLASVAGLFLAAEIGVGHPLVGEGYALASIAAAVLGGASLSGGRGSFIGAALGALFFALMTNVISILGLSSSVAGVASGLMTLLAIFLYTGLPEFDRLLRHHRRSRAGAPSPTAAE